MYKLSRTALQTGRALRPTISSRTLASQASASATTPVPTKEATTTTGSALPPTSQSPNLAQPWSTNQAARTSAYSDARFEQTNLEVQPQPLSAMELVSREPVRMVDGRIAVCDGGKGPLGHPKIFINLDQPKPKPCGYCGLRFQQTPHHH